jgi:hypothetical protein
VIEADKAQHALIETAAAEVDVSLLDWFRELTLTERLRSASRSMATLERMARATSTNR